MSQWKKIIVVVTLMTALLVISVYGYLTFYGLNQFKPMIAEAVRNATGGELAIDGGIELDLGLRPKLVINEVSISGRSATKGSKWVAVKRLETDIAFMSVFTGDIEAGLTVVNPVVHVEIDEDGKVNVPFVAGKTKKEDDISTPPPILFTDIHIENGRFSYRDTRTGVAFSVSIERLGAAFPGFNKPVQLEFKGAVNGTLLTLDGTVGPIQAWIQPGHVVSADLAVTSGGTTAKITGEIHDPIHFKDWAFDIAAQGRSVSEIAQLAGFSDMPALGAFEVSGRVFDAAGHPAVEKLDLHIGTEDVAALYLTGDIRDLLSLQGINLTLTVRGEDSVRLTRFGLPPIPEQGAFMLYGHISDPKDTVYALSDLNLVLGENVFDGRIQIDMTEQVPFLTARLSSQKFRLGQFDLDFTLSGPVEKPSVSRFDLRWGDGDLAGIRLSGRIGDLIGLNEVDLDFQMESRDLAELTQATNLPIPIKGTFSAAGKVVIPAHKYLKIPRLQIAIGKNRVDGSAELDLRGEKPLLSAQLSTQNLKIASLLTPKMAKRSWVRFVDSMNPIELSATIAGFVGQVSVDNLHLKAGGKRSQIAIDGTIADLYAWKGVELAFAMQGGDVAILQPFFDQPLPVQGEFALSGRFKRPDVHSYALDDLQVALADNRLSGELHADLTGEIPRLTVDVSAERFDLKPLSPIDNETLAKLKKVEDLGPLYASARFSDNGANVDVDRLMLTVGKQQLAQIKLTGRVGNLSLFKGVDLNFEISGEEISNLSAFSRQSLPINGVYRIFGQLSDPAANEYKLSNLSLQIGDNKMSGRLGITLEKDGLTVTTDLTAQKLILPPVSIPARNSLTPIPDLGPISLAASLSSSGKKWSLETLELHFGNENLMDVNLAGEIKDLSAFQGMNLRVSIKGGDIANLYKQMKFKTPHYKGTFDFSGRFFDPSPGIYKISNLNARWGESLGTGWLALDLSGKRPQVTGNVSSGTFDLRLLVGGKNGEHETETIPAKPNPAGEKVFSREPFHLDVFKTFDADVRFRKTQLIFQGLALDDTTARLLLKDGNLTIKPINFRVGGGRAGAQLSLFSRDESHQMTLNMDIDQLEIGPMLDHLGKQRSVEGIMDTDIRLRGSGNSMAALMAGLDGNIRIDISQGTVASKYLDLLEAYFGQNILQLINPFQEKRESTSLNCFVNQTEIVNGQANLKLFLDTDRTRIVGAGDINLKTEALDLGIKPTAKKGRGLNLVGFSLKELSQPFRLGGTLAKPALAMDPGRTFLTIGKAAGALALGPAGIAAFFTDISVDEKNPCANVLE